MFKTGICFVQRKNDSKRMNDKSQLSCALITFTERRWTLRVTTSNKNRNASKLLEGIGSVTFVIEMQLSYE